VIVVTPEQVSQVEYLLSQSQVGNHVLFEMDEIRRTFTEDAPANESACYAVEPHIERLLSRPTLAEKRSYLETLDDPTRRLVVRTYFNIVENNLFETQEMRH
jgi:hypothetical protein